MFDLGFRVPDDHMSHTGHLQVYRGGERIGSLLHGGSGPMCSRCTGTLEGIRWR